MTFAEDEVKKFIRRNESRFHCIRVHQIISYLPCLTVMDKQEVIANLERRGNNQAVWLLLDALQSRQGWVDELIRALQQNELTILAEEIRQVYEAHQVRPRKNSPARSAAPAAVNRPRSPGPIANSPSPGIAPGVLLAPKSVQPPSSTGVFSTRDPSSQEMGDYSAPIQDTKPPSQSKEMVVEPKTPGDAPKADSSAPLQNNTASPNVEGALRGDRPLDARAADASPRSPDLGPLGPKEMAKEEMQSTSPGSSGSGADNLVQKWDGRQQRPAYVKNGRFGSMNHLTDRGTPPASAVSCASRTSENQPEENYYSTSDSSLLAPSSGHEAPGLHISTIAAAQLPSHPPYHSPSGRESVPQVPIAMPSRGVGPLPSEFTDISSTHVIPPSSPAAVSGALGGMCPADLKPPIQETKLPLKKSDGRTTSEQVEEQVTSRSHAPGSSSRIFHSNHDNEDDVLCKPGALTSEPDEIAVGSAGQNLGREETHSAYSGRSASLLISSSIKSSESEPSQNSLSEECSGPVIGISGLESNATTGISNSSLHPENGNDPDSGSIETHTIHLEQNSSVDLTGAPEIFSPNSVPKSPSMGALPDSAPESAENPIPSKNVDDGAPFSISDTTLLAFCFALASVAAVAFVLFRRLKK